ncbi:MAG: hypothetical protein WBE08_04845 [Methyloceanibacter sp.]|jgi:hypothetical protein
MPRSFVLGLALGASILASAASAQTLGDNFNSSFGGGAGATPTLILPDDVTSPMTSGLGPEDAGGSPGGWNYQSPEEEWQQPYSVEGEEQLESGTN